MHFLWIAAAEKRAFLPVLCSGISTKNFLIPAFHSLIVTTLLSFSFLTCKLKFDLLKCRGKKQSKKWKNKKITIKVNISVVFTNAVVKSKGQISLVSCHLCYVQVNTISASNLPIYESYVIFPCMRMSWYSRLLTYVWAEHESNNFSVSNAKFPLWISQVSKSF